MFFTVDGLFGTSRLTVVGKARAGDETQTRTFRSRVYGYLFVMIFLRKDVVSMKKISEEIEVGVRKVKYSGPSDTNFGHRS